MDLLPEWLTAAEIDLTWWKAAVLVFAGILGGFINTIAGGGVDDYGAGADAARDAGRLRKRNEQSWNLTAVSYGRERFQQIRGSWTREQSCRCFYLRFWARCWAL